MKRLKQHAGIKEWYGDDILSLQEEPMKVLDQLLAQFGGYVVAGCEVTASGAKYKVAKGLVMLSGTNPDGESVSLVVPYAGTTTAQALPLYLSLGYDIIEDTYGDGADKPVAYDYKALASNIVPSTPYIEVRVAATPRLKTVLRTFLQDASNGFITDTERANWNAKETTIGSQNKATAAGTAAVASAKTYTDATNTAVRAAFASADATTLASAKSYADTLERAILASVATLYAKIASPTFTGSPTAPTPAASTNSTRLATTAFVQALGERSITITNFNTFNPYGPLTDRITGVAFTLEIGQSCAFYSNGAIGRPDVAGITIPYSLWTGRVYRVDSFYYGLDAIAYSSSSSTNPLRATRYYYATSASSSPYPWAAGSERLSGSTSGYTQFPSGMMIQWGSNYLEQKGLISIMFPLAFYVTPYNIQLTMYDNGPTGNDKMGFYITVKAGYTNTKFTYNTSANFSIHWLAIGRWR